MITEDTVMAIAVAKSKITHAVGLMPMRDRRALLLFVLDLIKGHLCYFRAVKTYGSVV